MSNVQTTLSARGMERLLGDWRMRGASYRSLADRIELLIVDGRISAYTRLPPERELAELLGHSRSTITTAYSSLRERGLVTSVRGSGSVVGLGTGRGPVDGPAITPVANLSHAVPEAWDGLLERTQRAVARLPEIIHTHGLDFYGIPDLRSGLADRFSSLGVATNPSQILVTLGAQHAIGLTARALLHRGDLVVLDVPSYPHAMDAFQDAGARLFGLPMPDERPSIQDWEHTLLSMRPSMAYVMPDFHNPTGSSLTNDERSRLAHAAARAGTILLIDETTSDLDIDRGGPRTPLAEYARQAGATAVTIGSASKTIWHGLRVGWVRASSSIIDHIASRRPASDLGSPALEQLIVVETLPAMAEIIEDRRSHLRVSRDVVVERIAKRFPTWQMVKPDGGLCLWINLGHRSSSDLALAARAHGLSITAGPRFGVDGAFERHIRIPFASPAPQLLRAIDLLGTAWDGLALTPEFAPLDYTPTL